MARYVMVIDLKRCVGCMACIMACKAENGTPPGLFRTRVVEVVSGEFPNLRMELKSELCNHCENPPCVNCCPTGASFKAKDGIVEIRKERCVGCRVCIAACPYDARFIDPQGYADKCSFCEHLVRRGKEPACVATCIGGSRVFGDLDDQDSPAARLLKESQATVLPNHSDSLPQVFYIRG